MLKRKTEEITREDLPFSCGIGRTANEDYVNQILSPLAQNPSRDLSCLHSEIFSHYGSQTGPT